MALSDFENKENSPSESDLENALGKSYSYWREIKEFVFQNYADAAEQWNFGGLK